MSTRYRISQEICFWCQAFCVFCCSLEPNDLPVSFKVTTCVLEQSYEWTQNQGSNLQEGEWKYQPNRQNHDITTPKQRREKSMSLLITRYNFRPLVSMMTSSNGNIFRATGLCVGNSPVSGEFPTQRPVTRSFDVFFDLHPNKRFSKQWWGWWFETLSCPLWRHRNGTSDIGY